jgi:carboxyl-terminal processing protease
VSVSAGWPRILALLVAFTATLVLGACGGGSGSRIPRPAADVCSIPQQNLTIYQLMQQYYLWYEELPELDPRAFPSPEALLDELRFAPLDRFSYLTTRAEEEALFGESQFVGLGFRTWLADGGVRVSDVFEGGPADEAGLVRGSTILAVDGVPIAIVLEQPGGFSAALGPAEVGYEVSLHFRNPDQQEYIETLAKTVVTIPPVTALHVFEVNGMPTGYLVLRNFVQPGIPALNEAFQQLRAAGVTQLIVDLRYNGGGLLAVLEHLADLLGSRIAPGAPFAAVLHNDKNTERDYTSLFRSTPLASALDLERLVLISTHATASASEMLINGMSPYVASVTVGSATYGKPVGQLGFLFCERILRPVSFRTVNSLGAGDYFDGIPADCPAGDTLDVPFGHEGEASYDAAVFWLEHGFCPVPETFEPLHVPLPPEERPLWQPNDAH